MISNSSNSVPVVRVFALGGLDENGKNLYCIETEDAIFVIECGSKYPDLTNPGVDIIIPDMTYLKEKANKVKAIIISHGHDDQFGALPYLLKYVNAPIYTTMTTAIFINADYGKRFKNIKFDFHIIKPSDDVVIANYKFHFFQTTHAVMESFGFSLETKAGNIVYTGDYISDFGVEGHFSFDISKIASIANNKETMLMLCESAGADKQGIASPTHKITPHIKSLFEDSDNRIFIALYTQNMYCINEVIELAKKNHKRIVLTNPKFIDVLPNFIANGDLIIPKANQCSMDEIAFYAPSDIVVLITGQGDDLFNDLKDLSQGDSKYRNIKLSSEDIFVLACPPVPATEINATEAIDSLYKTGAKIVNLNRKKLSSMHAQEEDIKMMINLFKPRYFMPVKGEYSKLMANARIALNLGYKHSNILLLDNGMSVSFDKNSQLVQFENEIKNGNIFVDGLGVGDVKSSIIEERHTMEEAGVIVLGATISTKRHVIVTQQDIQMRGFVYLKEADSVVKIISDSFQRFLTEAISNLNAPLEVTQAKFVETLTKELRRTSGKTPLIVPLIIDVD